MAITTLPGVMSDDLRTEMLTELSRRGLATWEERQELHRRRREAVIHDVLTRNRRRAG